MYTRGRALRSQARPVHRRSRCGATPSNNSNPDGCRPFLPRARLWAARRISCRTVPRPALAAPAPAAAASLQVDAVAVRDELVRFVDTWNGGQAGRNGTTRGGLFRMKLDCQFNPISYYTNDQTILSESRATHINVEAYRNAPASDRPRATRGRVTAHFPAVASYAWRNACAARSQSFSCAYTCPHR